MLAELKKEELAQGIQRVISGLPQKATLPILSYVRMKFEQNTLQLQTTDLDVFMNWNIVCDKLDGSLDVCIPVKRVNGILRELTSEKLTLENIEDTGLQMTTDSGKFQFYGLQAEEFPAFPSFEEDTNFSIKVADLKKMLDRTLYTVGTSETREVLNGLLLLLEENCFRLVGTDGRRLATEAVPGEVTQGNRMIVPRKAMIAVRACLDAVKKQDAEVSVGIGASHGSVAMESGSVVARLLEGDFPDYRDVIPTKPTMELKVSREELMLGCRRVGVFSGTEGTLIKMSVKEDMIVLSASSSDIGSASETISIMEGRGVEMELGINYRYVVDALSCLKDEEVYMDLVGSRRPVCFRSSDAYRSVVMPMRLEGVS